MNESSDDEEFEILARYVVAMHLEANRKVGKFARVATILGILAAIIMSNYWPLVMALFLCVAVYFYVINSCIRFVKQRTGIQEDTQAFFSRRYKTDPQFAKEVDKLREGASSFETVLKSRFGK